MNPQTTIPIATDEVALQKIIISGFKGVVNVLLRSSVVDYILSLSRNQRQAVPRAINSYVQSFMRYGYESIQLIHISDSGSFADGQHRLLALQKIYEIKPDFTPPWQLVMFGITADRIKDLDNGIPRRTKDVLRMSDKCHDAVIASALNTWVKLVRENSINFKVFGRELEEAWDDGFKDVTLIGEFPALKNVTLLNCHSYRPPAWVVVCNYITYLVYGLDVAKEAYNQFYNGTDSALPMVKFREWLIVNRTHVARPNLYSADNVSKLFGYYFFCIKKFVSGTQVDRINTVKLGKTIHGRRF